MVESQAKTPTSGWRYHARAFSWQWHIVIMSTGMCSSLLHNFPYHNEDPALQMTAFVFFLLDFFLFIFLFIWLVLRCMMFPEDWHTIFVDPKHIISTGFAANGMAALVNAGLAAGQFWKIDGNIFFYTLWGLWWIAFIICFIVSFGLLYVLMGENSRDIAKIGPAWAIPIITMVTISASGSLFTRALLPHSRSLALLSLTLSTAMLFIGLFLAMVFFTAFFIRIYLHGPLESQAVLSTFATLTPIGQGGYSMLINGQDLSDLLPDTLRKSPLVGDTLFTLCFSGAYVLWCMGLLWIGVSCFSVLRHGLTNLPAFNMSYWSLIVPNGAFSLLSIELYLAVDSPFFRIFGTGWSLITLVLWVIVFLWTAVSIADGSAITLTAIPETTDGSKLHDIEKTMLPLESPGDSHLVDVTARCDL